MKNKDIVQSLLHDVGITINGNKPYDVQIHNTAFYKRVLKYGSLGLGESYIQGWWDCENLDQFFHRIISFDVKSKIKQDWKLAAQISWRSLMYMGKKAKAFEVGEQHYDVGNDLYQTMLDKRMVYTCGYWKNAKNLQEAQENKLDLVCKKIGLKSGQKVLDIGSGWGSFAGFAAEKYGVHAVGVTVSKEQKKFADTIYGEQQVETRLQDYRDINEKFDHIVSLGMFEHVGMRNYRQFMKIAHHSLKDDGLFLLHTIGGNKSVMATDPWIEKYIFPNSMIPSIKQIGKSIEGLFVMEDWHNFGNDYDKTLMAWHENFENGWKELEGKYTTEFYRMWRYYLLSCAGSFRARKNQLWQIVLSKNGVKRGYTSVR